MNARRSVLTLIMLAASPAWSQTIWRCGSQYSEHPCEGGRAVAADDPRSAEQQADSQRAARRDAQLANGMEGDRLKQQAQVERAESAARQAQAQKQREAELADRRARAAAHAPTSAKPFTARVPGTTRPRSRKASKA